MRPIGAVYGTAQQRISLDQRGKAYLRVLLCHTPTLVSATDLTLHPHSMPSPLSGPEERQLRARTRSGTRRFEEQSDDGDSVRRDGDGALVTRGLRTPVVAVGGEAGPGMGRGALERGRGVSKRVSGRGARAWAKARASVNANASASASASASARSVARREKAVNAASVARRKRAAQREKDAVTRQVGTMFRGTRREHGRVTKLIVGRGGAGKDGPARRSGRVAVKRGHMEAESDGEGGEKLESSAAADESDDDCVEVPVTPIVHEPLAYFDLT